MTPLKPSMSLLSKLGSILVHIEELTSSDGHPFDAEATRSLLSDPEVVEWMKAMRKKALLPLTRRKP